MAPITTSGFLAVVAVVVAGSGALFGLLASATQQPVLLTMMAVLAMLGAFFLFAIAAGHVRISERLTNADIRRAVAEGQPHGVMVTGRRGETLYSNDAWQAFVGRAASGALRTFDQLVVGDAAASEALFRLARAAADRVAHSEDVRLPAADGGPVRWLRLSVAPLAIGSLGGTEDGVLWSAADISAERIRHASHVSELEQRLKLVDDLTVGVLSFRDDGAVQELNGTLAAWLGRDSTAARHLRLRDLMTEDTGHLLRVTGRKSEPDSGRVDIDLVRVDGRRIPVTASVGLRRTASGEDFVVAFLPVTIDKSDAAQPRGPEPRFARLFQSAPFGIATLSADGKILSANGAFGRMMLEPSSLEGRRITDVACRHLSEGARAEAERAIEQGLAGQGSVPPIEVPVGPNGDFTRRLYMSPLSQSAPGREAAVLFLIDATEQKALEIKFAQSQKMEAVGKLAGGIAHDFNNVLTAIIGFSDLLLQTHRPTDAAYKDIINIKSSANRAAGMVRQLLAFSRRQTLQAEVLQLGEVVTDLSALLNRAIGEKIELKIIPGRDLWYVKADKTQFEQVIINLAVNAGDAMPDGGRLTIRTRNITERDSVKVSESGMTPGEYVLVEVEDTGTGMTPEIMSKIFEPFFTTKGVGKGTGLGLATVYGIVKQTGGFIYPDSTPGKGTTFRVYLPRHQVAKEDEVAASKQQKKERPADLTGTGRVLLVEDEDVVRSFAVRALKRQGYEVLEASTGAEALEVMAKVAGKVDLVVSDVVMPEMDGPTMLKELRKTIPGLKFIFMSGYPDDAFKKGLGENEQFAFLPKPFSLPQLAQKVKEELERGRDAGGGLAAKS